MKPLLLFILLILPAHLFAPAEKAIVIPRSEGVNYYDPLIKAIVQVESSNGKYPYNEKENAVGHFQIRQVLLIDELKKFTVIDQKRNLARLLR